MSENVVKIDLDNVLFSVNGKEYFETQQALAVLLAEELLHFYNGKFHLNINDVFAWAYSETIPIDPDKDLKSIYEMYLQDKDWGTALWACIFYKELPQKPVQDMIRKSGKFDLDALTAEHGLRPNTYDAISHIIAKQKFRLCNDWRVANGKEPVEYNKDWWQLGWREFEVENPDWNTPELKAELDAEIAAWKENWGK